MKKSLNITLITLLLLCLVSVNSFAGTVHCIETTGFLKKIVHQKEYKCIKNGKIEKHSGRKASIKQQIEQFYAGDEVDYLK